MYRLSDTAWLGREVKMAQIQIQCQLPEALCPPPHTQLPHWYGQHSLLTPSPTLCFPLISAYVHHHMI